jgi:hypothetical protein
MTRVRLTSQQLLQQVRSSGGPSAAAAATRILEFGDSLQAQRISRQASISLRLPGPQDRQWLTLFLVTTSGNLVAWYAYRWEDFGLPATLAATYERRLGELFGPEVTGEGIPVTAVLRRWPAFSKIAGDTARIINHHVRSNASPAKVDSADRVLSALEGLVTEVRAIRRSRNPGLRKEALARSLGRCAACNTDFGHLLGGRGWRVLQVHHKDQLADRDQPTVTDIHDLVVVCANCHLLIHADREAALQIAAVRRMWNDELSPGARTKRARSI